MKLYKIASFCMVGLLTVGAVSCSSPDDEIKSLSFGRNFAPLGTEASAVKETTAVISWELSKGATSYNIQTFPDDSLTFIGEPERTITGLTEEDIPYTLTGLQFDTKYSVRIQAVTDGDEARTSNWASVFFQTSPKQFLMNPKPAQIADRSVTLTWEVEPGYDVTDIVIGDIEHEITAEERAAAQATITGLQPETDYVAYLYYNGKQCGNRPFTTIADLTGAILIHPGDDLKKAIEAEDVQDGAVFAVYGGTYDLNVNEDGQTGAMKIYKDVTIKGIYPTDQPVLKGRFEVYDGAALSISQCVIDGSNNASTDQIFNYKLDEAPAGTTFGALDVQSCTITGRADGKGLFYLNVQAIVPSVTFNNCVIYGIECTGGDFIDSRAGLPRKLNVTNSTIYNVATARDFIRIDDKASNFPGEAGPVVTVDHCTLYNVGGYGEGNTQANYRLLYVRFEGNELIFTNNLVVGTVYKRGFTNQSTSDADPTLNNNAYFGCENLTKPGAGADASIAWFDTDSSAYDVEGETGTKVRGKGNGSAIELTASPFSGKTPDFTLNPDGAAYKNGCGDPRWIQ